MQYEKVTVYSQAENEDLKYNETLVERGIVEVCGKSALDLAALLASMNGQRHPEGDSIGVCISIKTVILPPGKN